MKIQSLARLPWPTNPKTPEGWPKRVAIAMLSGLGIFLLSLPLSVLLLLRHYEELYPKDPQNLLSALTGAVVSGLILALVTIPMIVALLWLLARSRGKGTPSAPTSAR
jgi:ABC-type Fe3+ transport system permease subunit